MGGIFFSSKNAIKNIREASVIVIDKVRVYNTLAGTSMIDEYNSHFFQTFHGAKIHTN